MAYEKGDIQIEEGSWMHDARDENGYGENWRFADKKVAKLPHSCDSWIIGGVEEIDLMIADLEEAKKNLTQEGKGN